MAINFFEQNCSEETNEQLFGICDEPSPNKDPAYLDLTDGRKWIAVVKNEYKHDVTFVAIDACIDIFRQNGEMSQRADGFLYYDNTIIFTELKQRFARGNAWVEDGEEQLRETIDFFEKEDESENFETKKAYIANSEHPKFKTTQIGRMNRFLEDTGYVLRVENRIILE